MDELGVIGLVAGLWIALAQPATWRALRPARVLRILLRPWVLLGVLILVGNTGDIPARATVLNAAIAAVMPAASAATKLTINTG